MSWTTDIETILNDLRENSVYLSNYHKKQFFYYKRVATYFRLPTICISAVASVASVGLTNYVAQENISGIVCLMSLTVGMLNSIELYLRIQDNLESELMTSKSYYALSNGLLFIELLLELLELLILDLIVSLFFGLNILLTFGSLFNLSGYDALNRLLSWIRSSYLL